MNAGTSGVSANSGQVNASRDMPRARLAAAKPTDDQPDGGDRDQERSMPTRLPSRHPTRARSGSGPGRRRSRPHRARPARTARLRTPISASTRLVIPMLVAASARPTNAAVARRLPGDHARSPTPASDRQDHRDDGGQDGRTAHREQVVHPDLETDREQQDHDADLGQDRSPSRLAPRAPARADRRRTRRAAHRRPPAGRGAEQTSSPSLAPTNRMNTPSRRRTMRSERPSQAMAPRRQRDD